MSDHIDALMAYDWSGPGGPKTQTVFAAMRFIYSRTVRYGKLSESIPGEEFADGKWTRDGRRISNGTGLHKSALWRAVAALERAKLVRVRRYKDHVTPNRYSVRLGYLMATCGRVSHDLHLGG